LEQAAAIEAYAADPKAYQRLLRAANYPPGLHHALADERHKKQDDLLDGNLPEDELDGQTTETD
jgi:hypothetical protein